MKKLILLPLLLLTSVVFSQTRDFTRWVNPFIGTGGHGHTFPGATLPFGMVQLSPDTRIDNWDGSSGYHYSDDVISGFSHTHLSGTGIPDGCDILFMPTLQMPPLDLDMPQFHSGPGDRSVNGIASKFSHANEKAEPGYYSVILDDDGIQAELTATSRVGLHRYTFPKGATGGVINLDLEWRDKHLDSAVWFVGNSRIEGFRRSSSWAKNQTVYFAAEFSTPFAAVVQNVGLNDDSPHEASKHTKAAFGFDTTSGKPILLKVAISYVSIEGARANLKAELPGWDFDKVRADAKAAWNKELSKIEVSGGTDDQTAIFYTALYHTMIHPNVFNDVDGKYLGHDRKIHQLPPALPLGVRRSSASPEGSNNISGGSAADSRRSRESISEPRRKSGAFPHTEGQRPNPKFKTQNPQSEQYTVFSLWDTFRAAHPLYTIIDQKRTVDFINTFIRIYEQGGRLPVWELWGEETDTMIGYHAVSVIADAMAKGIEGFDYEKAYAAAKHSAELDHFGLAAYKKRGYISSEDDNESVSKTLEYAYDDWCIAQMGQILCDKGLVKCEKVSYADGALSRLYHPDNKEFRLRSVYYQNLFDKQTGFMRPRKNGGWIAPFRPNEVTFNFTEGNSWQYSFFVPHDIIGLTYLYGGRANLGQKLDELFSTQQELTGREQPDITGLIGQYAHGNEPSHHVAYLFNFADEASKTQKYVRKIMDEFYKATPDGLIGNEDCGQMSAWYVLSALGFYPVTPGLPEYQLGTPLFKEAKINLENGKTFTIRAPNVSEKNFYVRSARLNGITRFRLDEVNIQATDLEHSEITKGGLLEFEMSDRPGRALWPWALNRNKRSSIYYIPAAPILAIEKDRVENNLATFTIPYLAMRARVFYTIDGSLPTRNSTEYTKPISIKSGTVVKAIAISISGEHASPVVEAKFLAPPNDWKVVSNSGYSYQYTGGGDDAIVDGLRGTTNFTAGEWQGYQGKTFEAVIDLQRETPISLVGGSFLQSARSWIWMPDRIEFETSSDGVNFTRVAEIKPGFPKQQMEPETKEFTQAITPTRARYVRVRAFNFGKIPSWHPGAGGDPWIFVDEILIK